MVNCEAEQAAPAATSCAQSDLKEVVQHNPVEPSCLRGLQKRKMSGGSVPKVL